MRKEKIITLGNIKIEKRKFHLCENLISLEDVDVGNIQVSTMAYCSEKSYRYFISYKVGDDYKIKPLHVILPKRALM